MAAWPVVKTWLFRYVVTVAILAFSNRTLPTSFLPLVLDETFGEPYMAIGIAMAMYPAAALVSSPWATRVALDTDRPLRMHTLSLLAMAAATVFFAGCEEVFKLLGSWPAMTAVISFRAAQGVTSALYMSTNTTLVTRYFPDCVPYVLGMVEVGVGLGAQLGRIVGGYLYDFGGFGCPFLALAVVQGLVSLSGFTVRENSLLFGRPVLGKEAANLPWKAFLTKRSVVGLFTVFANYFIAGYMDTTVPAHLERRIGPISVSTLSVLISLRSFSYLVSSFAFAQVMYRDWISYERMIAWGAVVSLIGLVLLGPAEPIDALLLWAFPNARTRLIAVWVMQMLSLILVPAGLAAQFIPTLPWIQDEVRHLGSRAVEQVTQPFIVSLSLGETVGPILGGAILTRLGFAYTTLLFTVPFWLILFGCIATYDNEVARRRQAGTGIELDFATTPALLRRTNSKYWAGNLMDGESAYQFRRLRYALKVEAAPPVSAPALAWRRTYSPAPTRHKPWASVPAQTSRRAFVPRPLPAKKSPSANI